MFQNFLIVMLNGLIEAGAFVFSETLVLVGFVIVWQFSRWELLYEHDLSVGIGPDEELL